MCGYRDITDTVYSGASGKHDKFGNATTTTNGAGPHNLQLFMLASDGTVLHCLPGFWTARDLVVEMDFASRLNEVWKNKSISKDKKDQLFKSLQLSHIKEHDHQMVARSEMQGFDKLWEAQHRPSETDTIKNAEVVKAYMAKHEGHIPHGEFKTTDVIMHERMSQRPFLTFTKFDVAEFSDYGKPVYDKNEDMRDVRTGQLIITNREKQMIGNPDAIAGKMKPMKKTANVR